MEKEQILDILQSIAGLEEVPVQQLEWFIASSEIHKLKEGEYLFEKGSSADHLFIQLSGEIRVFIRMESGEREVSRLKSGAVSGLLPYSRMTHATGYGQAREDSSYLAFPRSGFDSMIIENHELTQAFVHMMTSRVREFTTRREQNEKMMALGKLSAGLAHELNNPSSAIVRSAQELSANLVKSPESFNAVLSLDLKPEQVNAITQLMQEQISNECPPMSMLERSALEDDIADWLEDHNVEDGFELAEQFVDKGYTVELLERMADAVPQSAVGAVMNWVASSLVTEVLVSEIQTAAERISELVGSVKSYSHMDRGSDKSSFDIHEGLNNTLTMLNHKIKKGGVELVKEYDVSLPKIEVRVSELNQVWTNLIDNAIDAVTTIAKPKLTVRTLAERDMLCIDIEDNGSGIPEDIVSQIFDPFFTTKDVGKGTGLGLEISRRIINQHQGKLSVRSEPGKTVFRACLPSEPSSTNLL